MNSEALKRAEGQMRESEERLRDIFDGTYEYIGLLSPDGKVLEANRASLEFAGNPREDVVGLPFWDTVWFANTPGAPKQVKQAVALAAAGEFVRFEATVRRPSGEPLTFDISLHPIRNVPTVNIRKRPQSRYGGQSCPSPCVLPFVATPPTAPSFDT